MDLGIAGRKAIVNGGSAGMGRSTALALAREGVEVFVSARREDRLVKACNEIAEETGAKVTPVCADHSSVEGRERILAACPEPDILVGTCAPPPMTPDYRAITDEQWIESTQACCGVEPPSDIHAGLAELLQRYDVNDYAASVQVYAVKPA